MQVDLDNDFAESRKDLSLALLPQRSESDELNDSGETTVLVVNLAYASRTENLINRAGWVVCQTSEPEKTNN